MKVLYLIAGIAPPAAWGSEMIYDLICTVRARDIETTIITPIYHLTPTHWRVWMDEETRTKGIRFIVLDSPEWLKKRFIIHYPFALLQMTIALFRELRRRKYDIVHDFSSSPLLFFRTQFAGTFYRCKTVVTISGYLHSWMGSYNIFWFLRGIDKIVCSTNGIVRKLRKICPPSRLVQIPFGIKFFPTIDKRDALRKLGLSQADVVFMYTGPIDVKKGIYQYVRVINDIAGSMPKAFFIIVISRGLNIKNYAALKLTLLESMGQNNIKILEGVCGRVELYSAADVIVLPQQNPSGTIAPPATLIDAMSAGCCVVGTNTDGLRDIIDDGKNGFLYEKDSDSQLSNLLRRLYSDKHLRHTVGSNAKVKIHSEFTIDACAEKYVELYQNVLRMT